MMKIAWHFLLFIALVLNSCESSSITGSLNSGNPEYLTVTKVVDGDTFWVDNGTAKGLRIRLIGIDAPESRKVYNREIGYFGKEAETYLTKLIGGKRVKLVSDIAPLDRFGRTLSYVYLEDGTFVNAELIKNGYAVLMTIQPNVEFTKYFAGLQREARDNRRGLWGRLK